LISKQILNMTIFGSILKQSINISSKLSLVRKIKPIKRQRKVLLKLLNTAKNTKFGKFYRFNYILFFKNLLNKNLVYTHFKNTVPIHDYNKMYNEWWYMAREGEKNVCWPGEVKHFALSSGTSEAASKAIPVTRDMIKAIHKTSLLQILSIGNSTNLTKETFEKEYLFLGGCTQLNMVNNHLEGDLSGITVGKMPFWFERFFKPGKQISQIKNWDEKLDIIAENAPEWDIAFVAGVPAWVQMLFERIIARHNVRTIHDIWPNLLAYGWGGVAIDSYKVGFNSLLDTTKPFYYLETYLASEGFFAFQPNPGAGLQLVLNKGIFFEFIPFTSKNFDDEGNLRADAEAFMINQVCNDVEYALLISTCAGAWRYLIGDTIKFTNVAKSEIKITGRTKHFLSLCGEHLSVDNMNQAIAEVAEKNGLFIKEFTVIGGKEDSSFTHHWYIGCNQEIDEESIGDQVDRQLRLLNDDYALERKHALKHVHFTFLPTKKFLDWLKLKGKEGGQTKFPRVLKGEQADDWQLFVKKDNSKLLLKNLN
jgi:GH3 auxin-responsive promoter